MSGKLKKTVSALLRDAEALQTVEPELCCTLFRKGLNISGLTKRLRIADETWIEEFLELGGLDDIFFALNSFSGRSFMDMKDVVTQLMCVQAVGEIMNKEIGLRYMVHENGKKHIKELVLGELIMRICTLNLFHFLIFTRATTYRINSPMF